LRGYYKHEGEIDRGAEYKSMKTSTFLAEPCCYILTPHLSVENYTGKR